MAISASPQRNLPSYTLPAKILTQSRKNGASAPNEPTYNSPPPRLSWLSLIQSKRQPIIGAGNVSLRGIVNIRRIRVRGWRR